MDYEKLVNLATDVGCRLMSSGAEIYRVEDSVSRVLRAYGVEAPEVFALPNCLIVSINTPDGRPITRMRRIPVHGTDIEELDIYNEISRELCSQTPPVGEALDMLSRITSVRRSFRPTEVLLGYSFATAFFTLLFGGSAMDAVCAFVCGSAVGLCLMFGSKIAGRNGFFLTVLGSAVAAFLAHLLVVGGLGFDVDTITIGVLMLLVPGVPLTNAMREILAGDIYSGLSRAAEAILTAAAIALGVAVGIALGLPV